MPRIQLRIIHNPNRVEAFIKVKRHDEGYEWLYAVVDTGASVSLLPSNILELVSHRLSENSKVRIEQAGIAKQSFDGVEAYVTLLLEDSIGTQSNEYEVRVWFAETDVALLGIDGILTRAALFIDIPNLNGYIEFNE